MNPNLSSGIYLIAAKEAECRMVVENYRKHDNKKKASAIKSTA